MATLEKLVAMDVPIIVALNKVDKSDEEKVKKQIDAWSEIIPRAEIFPISALHKFNVESLFERLVELLPESPPFFR